MHLLGVLSCQVIVKALVEKGATIDFKDPIRMIRTRSYITEAKCRQKHQPHPAQERTTRSGRPCTRSGTETERAGQTCRGEMRERERRPTTAT